MCNKMKKTYQKIIIAGICTSMGVTNLVPACAADYTAFEKNQLKQLKQLNEAGAGQSLENFDFDARTGTIRKYKGSETEVTVPEEINGVKVLAIGDDAFSGCSTLEKIHLNKGLQSIGERAFSSSSLKSIEIPEGVTKIGKAAFIACTKLKYISLPDSITEIGTQAFTRCTSLLSIRIPAGMSTIGSSVFTNCEKLVSVVIPATVTKIEDYSFADSNTDSADYYVANEEIKNMLLNSKNKIPESKITVTGSEVFEFDAVRGIITRYNGRQENVDIPSEIDGVKVKGIGMNAFKGCSEIKTVNVPDSVTYIDDYAFLGCYNMIKINLPDSITSIGRSAFANCYYLQEIVIPSQVRQIEDYCFYGCSNLASVTVPASVKTIGSKGAFPYENENTKYNAADESVRQLLIDAGVKKMNIYINGDFITSESAFDFDEATGTITNFKYADEKVVIPSTIRGIPVKRIGAEAFFEKSKLKYIEIPEGVTEISGRAFYQCINLNEIVIPSTVVSIGTETFAYCSSLRNVELPDNLRIIGSAAFYLSGVSKINIPEGITNIKSETFYGCSNLTEIILPESLTDIGEKAFFGCSELQKVSAGKKLENLGYMIFDGCYKVKVHVPDEKIKNLFVRYGTPEYKIVITESEQPEVGINRIILDKSSMDIKVGESAVISARVEPEEAADKKVIWISSDESIASIDENGTIRGLKAGHAIITCASEADSNIKAECTINVVSTADGGSNSDDVTDGSGNDENNGGSNGNTGGSTGDSGDGSDIDGDNGNTGDSGNQGGTGGNNQNNGGSNGNTDGSSGSGDSSNGSGGDKPGSGGNTLPDTDDSSNINNKKISTCSISGTERVGKTLKVKSKNKNNQTMTDGLTYTWYRSKNKDFTSEKEIGTKESYKLKSSDEGYYIKVVVSDSYGSTVYDITSKIKDRISSDDDDDDDVENTTNSSTANNNTNANNISNSMGNNINNSINNVNSSAFNNTQQLHYVNGNYVYLSPVIKNDSSNLTGQISQGSVLSKSNTRFSVYNGEIYITKLNGEKLTGWQLIDDKWYLLNTYGAVSTGWQYYDGKWYYMYSDGSMAHDTFIDGYYLASNGQWVR